MRDGERSARLRTSCTAENCRSIPPTSGNALPRFTGGQVAARDGVARRRLVAERRVSVMVVFPLPIANDGARVGQRPEHVDVKAFIA
jgi:hypothetical protein